MSLQFIHDRSSAPHDDAVWQLAWTSKGQVISGSADGGIRIWDPTSTSPHPTHHLKPHRLGITSLTVSNPTSSSSSWRSLALTTSLDGVCCLIDLERGKVVARKETVNEELEDGGHVSAWSTSIHPSGTSWASTGQGSKIAFYSIPSSSSTSPSDVNMDGEGEGDGKEVGEEGLGKLEKVVESGKSRFGMCLRHSPDGKSLALSTDSGQIYILDTETQSIVASHASHAMCARGLSWSLDSQYLFSASDDRRIVLHDIRAGGPTATGRGSSMVAELQGHSSWVLSVAASPDGRLLVSGGADSTVKVWDVAQRSCVSTTNVGAQTWAVEWQPTGANQARVGKDFVLGGDDNRVTWMKAAGSG